MALSPGLPVGPYEVIFFVDGRTLMAVPGTHRT